MLVVATRGGHTQVVGNAATASRNDERRAAGEAYIGLRRNFRNRDILRQQLCPHSLSLSLSLLPNYGGTGDGDGGGPVAERRRRQRWRRQRGDGERPTRGEPSDGLTKGARRPNSSAAPPLARTLPVLYSKYITPATSSS